jgi:hypothetical protein
MLNCLWRMLLKYVIQTLIYLSNSKFIFTQIYETHFHFVYCGWLWHVFLLSEGLLRVFQLPWGMGRGWYSKSMTFTYNESFNDFVTLYCIFFTQLSAWFLYRRKLSVAFKWIPVMLKFKICTFSILPKEWPYCKRFCANFQMELSCER